LLYPLSYGGPGCRRGYQPGSYGRAARPAMPMSVDAVSLRVVSDCLGRVLVVDDSDSIRELISVNLELEGFEVVTAADGEEALEKAVEVTPDVVTLDVVMPRLDGFAAAERLRRDERTRHIKIAMVTASAQAVDLRRGGRIGVDGYLTKPFDPAELIRLVRQLAGCPEEPATR
jgi:CheY-like chemotaxis protein